MSHKIVKTKVVLRKKDGTIDKRSLRYDVPKVKKTRNDGIDAKGVAASAIAFVRMDPELAYATVLMAHRMGMSKNGFICLTLRRALGLSDFPDPPPPKVAPVPEVAARRELGKDVPEVVRSQIERQYPFALPIPQLPVRRIHAIPPGPGFPSKPSVKPSFYPGKLPQKVNPAKGEGASGPVSTPSFCLSAAEPKAKRGRQLPVDFREWEGVLDYAHAKGVFDIAGELEHFCDHHSARGTVFADWLAAWRGWCRNALKYQARSAPNVRQVRPAVPTVFSEKMRVAEEIFGKRFESGDLFEGEVCRVPG